MTLVLNSSTTTNGNRSKPKVCLDSTIFEAVLAPTKDATERGRLAQGLLQDAAAGQIEIVVSALLLVECAANPDEAGGDAVLELFESAFVTRCNVDPFTGELARQLRRDLHHVTALTASGWLWLATALLTECSYLMSYDKALHRVAGQAALGQLQVGAPTRPWVAQLSLVDVEGVMPSAPLVATVTRRSLLL